MAVVKEVEAMLDDASRLDDIPMIDDTFFPLQERKEASLVHFAGSVKGMRAKNEDNYLVMVPGNKGHMVEWLDRANRAAFPEFNWRGGQDYARFAVADGMGGHAGGQEISQMAMELLKDYPPMNSVEGMRDMVYSLHNDLYEMSRSGKLFDHFGLSADSRPDGPECFPGTTLLVVDVHIPSRRAVVASLGDSRAYSVLRYLVDKLTCDHTFDEFDFREGDLSEEEYLDSLERSTNEVVQALGFGSIGLIKEKDGFRPNRFNSRVRLDLYKDIPKKSQHADVFTLDLDVDEGILLATDGLWNPSPEGHWQKPLTDDFLSANELQCQLDKALADGSKDNVTALVFGFKGEG